MQPEGEHAFVRENRIVLSRVELNLVILLLRIVEVAEWTHGVLRY
jgi:hypothetical protein